MTTRQLYIVARYMYVNNTKETHCYLFIATLLGYMYVAYLLWYKEF